LDFVIRAGSVAIKNPPNFELFSTLENRLALVSVFVSIVREPGGSVLSSNVWIYRRKKKTSRDSLRWLLGPLDQNNES
jgi:hypothetical protein